MTIEQKAKAWDRLKIAVEMILKLENKSIIEIEVAKELYKAILNIEDSMDKINK